MDGKLKKLIPKTNEYMNKMVKTIKKLNPCFKQNNPPLDELELELFGIGNRIGSKYYVLFVKSIQVWQVQSWKRQISHPKQTQVVQPLQSVNLKHPL